MPAARPSSRKGGSAYRSVFHRAISAKAGSAPSRIWSSVARFALVGQSDQRLNRLYPVAQHDRVQQLRPTTWARPGCPDPAPWPPERRWPSVTAWHWRAPLRRDPAGHIARSSTTSCFLGAYPITTAAVARSSGSAAFRSTSRSRASPRWSAAIGGEPLLGGARLGDRPSWSGPP